ncbi:twin-arginine translocation signal domain-containing protein [Dankookia sp. P2]|uniref:twin-arginine translocation signal domain-containing protein n=1 Tax=Dankookia sp. P2 TaxID=3423955 RepID=UPI003D66F3B6
MAETYRGLSGSGADRRSFLKQAGLGGAGLAALGGLPPRLAQAQPRDTPDRAVPPRRDQECLHPLFRRLQRHRRGAERRLDRPGAGLRVTYQPRHPLRQGRLGA